MHTLYCTCISPLVGAVSFSSADLPIRKNGEMQGVWSPSHPVPPSPKGDGQPKPVSTNHMLGHRMRFFHPCLACMRLITEENFQASYSVLITAMHSCVHSEWSFCSNFQLRNSFLLQFPPLPPHSLHISHTCEFSSLIGGPKLLRCWQITSYRNSPGWQFWTSVQWHTAHSVPQMVHSCDMEVWATIHLQ